VSEANGFLSRWARRKAQAKTGVVPGEPPALPVEATPVQVPVALAPSPPQTEPVAVADAAPIAEPPPTLDDVALLTRESDYSRFVAPGVDGRVRNAAMKKLFSDPHFNVMDGLDTYIDDYGKPDPIPESMLRMMHQSKFLGLFDDEEKEPAARAGADGAAGLAVAQSSAAAIPSAQAQVADAPTRTEPENPPNEDADLRLQQDDAAGRPGPDQGARA
jgi:hypothetical protein